MPKHVLIDYKIKRQGGSEDPNYREINFPDRKYGPRLFLLEVRTGRLYEHMSTDPIPINHRVTGELVEDEGLRRLVLDQ